MPKPFSKAIDDITRGLSLTHVWGVLGFYDIKQRYRRSSLGPFWLTISMGIMIGTMGVLYARLFGQAVDVYLPYLAVSLVLWTFMASTVNDLCTAFITSEQIIKQIKLPLTVHISRVVWRNVIILGHNAIILIPIGLWYANIGLLAALSAILGAVFLAAISLWMGVILGIVCTRFRDIPQIVASLTQITFFLSPVLWRPEVLGNRIWVAKFNPIFHLLELVRAPLISGTVPLESWLFSACIFVVLALIALPMLSRLGHRVAYWV